MNKGRIDNGAAGLIILMYTLLIVLIVKCLM